MMKLPGVIAKDTMSAMVKLAEMFQEFVVGCHQLQHGVPLSDDFL